MLHSEFMKNLHTMEYLYPCKNKGACRELLFNQYDIEWLPSFRTHGNITLTRHEPVTATHVYKSCTQCHMPINDDEAIKANKFLGNKLSAQPTTDDDADFLEMLNALE